MASEVNKEALSRSWRTLVQGAIATVLITVIPVFQAALTSGVENVNWELTGAAALTAALTSISSYVYNLLKPAPAVAAYSEEGCDH